MVGFHPINRVMTVGTFLFIASLIVMVSGWLIRNYYGGSHLATVIWANFFLYGLLAFVISVILVFVGTLLGARSGKLQERASNIWNNRSGKR
jgi:Flp pilus assembly pilin Flp